MSRHPCSITHKEILLPAKLLGGGAGGIVLLWTCRVVTGILIMNRVEPQGILVMGIFSINHEGVLLIPRPGSGGGDDEGEGWLLWSPEYYTYDPPTIATYISIILN